MKKDELMKDYTDKIVERCFRMKRKKFINKYIKFNIKLKIK